jgi:hypothetical protein
VPAEISPPELARLVDFTERPRVDDWSLRSALVRYAQPEPQRVSDLLDAARRIEWALGKNASTIERDGDALWNALEHGGAPPDAFVVGVLQGARQLDDLGDVLATWAVDINRPRPDAEVDRVVAEVARHLDEIGVPKQEAPPGPRNRG